VAIIISESAWTGAVEKPPFTTYRVTFQQASLDVNMWTMFGNQRIVTDTYFDTLSFKLMTELRMWIVQRIEGDTTMFVVSKINKEENNAKNVSRIEFNEYYDMLRYLDSEYGIKCGPTSLVAYATFETTKQSYSRNSNDEFSLPVKVICCFSSTKDINSQFVCDHCSIKLYSRGDQFDSDTVIEILQCELQFKYAIHPVIKYLQVKHPQVYDQLSQNNNKQELAPTLPVIPVNCSPGFVPNADAGDERSLRDRIIADELADMCTRQMKNMNN
jgi:hypothetical protein